MAASVTLDALTFTTEYDALDRTTKTTRPGNRVATVEYDALGQITKTSDGVGTALARFSSMSYDLAGNLTSVTDPLSHTTNYGYNARNERTSMTDALGGVTAFAFDKVGNLVSLTDPVNNTTTWAYDDAQRMSKQTDPRGKSTTYARDKNGNVTAITDRLGRVREYSFDANNRTTAETWKTSGGATVQTQTFSYDANGNLMTATDPDGNYAMSYDRFDRPVTVAQPFGVAQTFTYDANDNRLTASDNKGGVLTSGYDNLDRLTSRELGGTGVAPMKASWAYNAAAEVQTVTRQGKTGASWATAGATTFTHDDLGRTTNIRLADASNATLSQYGYTLDGADRITAMTVNGTSRTFSYDATNQLLSDNGTSLAYDKNGNRTGGSYATVANNRLTSDGTWTYSYDDEGNTTSKSSAAGTWNYSFDFRNQMTSASYAPTGGSTTKTVTQSFDAFGNRIERDATVNDVSSVEKFVVDGWDTTKPGAVGAENFDVAIDLDASGNVTNRRMFGAGFDELLGGQDGTGAVRWYGTDHLGSVRTIFDNSGTVTNTVDYDAFGSFLGGVPVDRYAYTGREYDAVTGLTHYRAREKDGHRFLSEDPKGFGAGDPNLARYVGNSPTGRRDPSGMQERPPLNTSGVAKQITEKEKTNGYWNKVRLGREFRKYERLNKAIKEIEASECSDDQVVQKHLAIMKYYRDRIKPSIEPKGWTDRGQLNDFRLGGENETPEYDVPDHELPEALEGKVPEEKAMGDMALQS